jgi:hypothetical protein
LLILFVICFSLKASGKNFPGFPTELLVLIGDFSHSNQTPKDLWCTQILNKNNFFGKNRHEFFSFLRIKTPQLFLTCKALSAELYLKPAVAKHDLPDGLEEQLSFLQQFQLSEKRKYFVWQMLTDQYFNRYEGLIKKRNALLTFNDPNASLFHATIDFYKQEGELWSFHRTPKSKRSISKQFEQQHLDIFTEDKNRGIFLDRYYIDIGFLKNFDWISKVFNQNRTYEKISPQDQCLISYLFSALDFDFSNRAYNQAGLLRFLQTHISQKILISRLKEIKKKSKVVEKRLIQWIIRSLLQENHSV